MRFVFLLGMVFLVSACGGLREYYNPSNPEGADQVDLTYQNAQRYSEIEPIAAWWHEFEDPLLARLVEKAVQENLDVRIAIANLAEARAIARESGFDRFPTVTASSTYSRELVSQQQINPAFSPQRAQNFYSFGFDALWEMDLFGRVSEAIKAERALAEATQEDLKQVYVTISAEVASTYIQTRGAQYRLEIARRNVLNQNETFGLTQKLMSGGRGTMLDTARAKTQVELTRATIPALEAQVMAGIYRLSVLTGEIPDNLYEGLSEIKPLPGLPQAVFVGDSASLLRRRPDIRSAERNLAATVARYNVEVTQLFPTVDIIGSLGYFTPLLGSISNSALEGAVGPSLSWRAFDLGRVRADIDAADAISLAALANYERTVLLALEETQTALSDFRREEERRAILHRATRSARDAARIARQRYDQGVDDFLDVLDAEGTLLEAEDTLADSEINVLLDLISIYRALGGGWQISATDEDVTGATKDDSPVHADVIEEGAL